MNSPKRRSLCWVFRLIGVIAAGTCLGFAPPNLGSQVPTVQQLADRYWSLYCARFPTQCALDRQDPLSGNLEDLSPAANRKWQQDLNTLLIDTDRIPRPTLSADDRLTLDLLQRCIRDEILRASLPWALVPITPVSGPQIDLTNFDRDTRVDDAYIARLRAFPIQIADLELNMHTAAQSGFVLPCLLVERTVPQVNVRSGGRLIKLALIVPLSTCGTNETIEESNARWASTTAAVNEQVDSALRSLHAYLLDEYMPLCRNSIGLGDITGGDAIYAAALRLHATIPIKPEEAHEMGVAEVARLRKELASFTDEDIRAAEEWRRREAVGSYGYQLYLPLNLPEFRRHARFTAFFGSDLLTITFPRQPSDEETRFQRIVSVQKGINSAAMLVIDTGIHAKGWSYDRAVAYMRENTTRTDEEIESDVIRCISLPGEAAGAEIGRQHFDALRREAEEKLGDRFDLRVFNEFMLSGGPMPLDMLETRMRVWIAEQAKSP
ncbi:MAG: DUF885 domain-containing protein [Phycisphaerae bacterium]|nr:DUF885 domain-containing protein [Phycisphaerae bacterium]